MQKKFKTIPRRTLSYHANIKLNENKIDKRKNTTKDDLLSFLKETGVKLNVVLKLFVSMNRIPIFQLEECK